MSAGAGPVSKPWHSQEVLGELLHSLSQPLTSLHCVLENSLAQDEVSRSEDVALALEQTDRAIEAVRLLRDYIEAGQGCSSATPAPLSLAIDRVLHQLSVLAEVRGVHLFAYGATKAAVSVRHPWLQRALTYLVGALIEAEQSGGSVTILLEDRPSQSLLSGHSLPIERPFDRAPLCSAAWNSALQVRVAIARRALESSGLAVDIYSGDRPSFTIRVPHSCAELTSAAPASPA